MLHLHAWAFPHSLHSLRKPNTLQVVGSGDTTIQIVLGLPRTAQTVGNASDPLYCLPCLLHASGPGK